MNGGQPLLLALFISVAMSTFPSAMSAYTVAHERCRRQLHLGQSRLWADGRQPTAIWRLAAARPLIVVNAWFSGTRPNGDVQGLEKLTFNVVGKGSCAALSRSFPCTAGLGVTAMTGTNGAR